MISTLGMLWLPRWVHVMLNRYGSHSAVFDIQYRVMKFHSGCSVPWEVTPWTAPNKIVDTGLAHLLKLATGELTTTLNNANARLGSGDSSTAAAAGQTNLQAATNKTWVAMDATFPTAVASNTANFQSTFPAGTGTWSTQEVGIARGDPGAGGILIGRKVQNFGSKAAGDQWIYAGALAATSAS